MIRWLLSLCLILVTGSVSAQTKRYWMADFVRLPQYADVQMSPGGRYLSAVTPVMNKNGENYRNLVVIDIDQPENSKLLTQFDSEMLGEYHWVSDKTLVYRIEAPADEASHNALVRLDRETGATKPLNTSLDPAGGSHVPVVLLSRLSGNPNQVLVAAGGQRPDVLRIDLNGGPAQRVIANPGAVASWYADASGAVRVARSESTTSLSLGQVSDDGTVTARLSIDRDGSTLRFLGFDADSGHWIVQTHGGIQGLARTDVAMVVRYDPAAGQFGTAVVDDAPFEITEFERTGRNHLMAVGYLDNTLHWRGTSSTHHRMLRSLKALSPDHTVRVASASDDRSRLVIWRYHEADPGEYFLYQPAEKMLETLFAARPWIVAEDMIRSQPFDLQTSDGLTLRGYLTPANEGPNAPLVVLPHDGIESQDSIDGFDPVVQFLAHQGFSVLRLNHRASSGYGLSNRRTGWGQWGRKIQDDFNEAVAWVASQSLADTQRVCLFGRGYGGLIAMIGVTRDPELYRCAITYGGISDLNRHLDSGSEVWGDGLTQDHYRWLGHPDQDGERLREISPVNRLDRLQAPVLIIHGRRDATVRSDQASRLRHAMRKADKSFGWLVKNEEPHEFLREKNLFELFETVDTFLRQNLSGESVASVP